MYRCPKCGNDGGFRACVKAYLHGCLVTNDGYDFSDYVDSESDVVYEGPMECEVCGYSSNVSDFWVEE